MDIHGLKVYTGSISSQIPIQQSDLFGLFVLNRFLKYDGKRQTSSWKWLQSEYSVFQNVAHNRRWRERFKEALNSGLEEMEALKLEELSKVNRNGVNMATEYLARKHKYQLISPSYSPMWIEFRMFVDGYKEKCQGHPAGQVLDYIVSQENQMMGQMDILLWMYVAYIEFSVVESGWSIGSAAIRSENEITTDEDWVPTVTAEGLCTSRWKIIGKVIERRTSELLSPDEKGVLRKHRRPKYWNRGDEIPDQLTVDAILIKLDDEMLGLPKNTGLSAEQKEFFRGQMHFVDFFSFMQIKLFESGLTGEEIVKIFSRLPLIRNQFYDGLLSTQRE